MVSDRYRLTGRDARVEAKAALCQPGERLNVRFPRIPLSLVGRPEPTAVGLRTAAAV